MDNLWKAGDGWESICCDAKVIIEGNFNPNGVSFIIQCTKCKGFLETSDVKKKISEPK